MITPADIEQALAEDPGARPFWEGFSAMKAFPETRRLELFRCFMSSRREMLDMLERAGRPTSGAWEGAAASTPKHAGPRPDVEDRAAYAEYWRSWYDDADTQAAQREARSRLNREML